MTARDNYHATVVILGRHGVLIAGPSGAGKTTLALDLIERWKADGAFASLVADDQVWLSAHSRRLVAEAPEEIAGLAEIRGFGPAAMRNESMTVVDLVIKLVPEEDVPRYREYGFMTLLGVYLPKMDLSVTPPGAAVRAITAFLRAN